MKCSVTYSPIPLPEIRLYHDKEKCDKFLSKHTNQTSDDTMMAQVITFGSCGDQHCVVLMPDEPDSDWLGDMELLVHEATHCTIYAFESIGEDRPGEETFCYMEQAIATALIKAHFEWKEQRRGRHDLQEVL